MSSANERLARALLVTFSQDEPQPEARQKALAALCAGSAAAAVSTTAGAKAALGATSATSVGVFGIGKAFIAGAVAAVVGVQISDQLIAPRVDRSIKEVVSTSGPSRSPRFEHPGLPGETRVEAPPPPPTPPTDEAQMRVDDGARPSDLPPAPLPISTGVPRSGLAAPPPIAQEASRGHLAPSQGENVPTHTPQAIPVPSATIDPPPMTGTKDGPALVEEVRRIDRARAALHAGSAAQALAELDRYEADFPSGSLRPEAMVVRIELLVRTGDVARARALAQAFALAYPTSGHLSKIRQLLAPDRGPSSP